MKYRVIILCLLIVTLLCGCNNNNSVTKERAEKDFAIYEQNFSLIVEEKNYSFKKIESSPLYSDDSIFNDYDISIDDNQSIRVRLYVYSGSAEKFEIIYKMNNLSQNFDIDTMVSLINAVSGKKVTKEYIEWFLSTPEEEFKNHGRDKDKDDVIFKFEPLNFWENWTISYCLKDDGSQKLVFYGVTDSNR